MARPAVTAPTALPLEPLERRVSWMIGRERSAISTADLALALGVHVRSIHRWRSRGGTISAATADRLAVHLGWHPCAIWEDWA